MGFNIGRVLTGIATGGLSEAIPYATGAKGAERQAKRAMGDINAARAQAIEDVMGGYGEPGSGAYGQLEPIAGLYDQYIGPYSQQATTGLDPAARSLAQLASMSGAYPTTPNLPRFNFDMESDPVYQFQQDQAEKALARRMAYGGRLDSSDALNALTQGTMDLAGRYGQDAFNRAVTGYGLDYGREMDTYGANVNRDNTLYGRGQNQFQNEMGLSDARFNRLGSLVGLGTQGRTGLASNRVSRANTLANISTGTGSQLSNINMDIGGLQVATSPLNTLSSLASTASRFIKP